MPRFDTGAQYDADRYYDATAPLLQIASPMKKPKIEAAKLNVTDLAVTGARIKDMMTTNAALFPNSAADVTALAGEVTDLIDANAEYETARLEASVKLAARDGAAQAVRDRLSKKLAGQVHDVAQGDVEVIHKAGMLATNDPNPVPMTQVQNLKIKASDQDAELLAAWKPQDASYYKVQISTDATPGNWKDHVTTTKSKCKLNHTLVSATKVYVRVCAGNSNGEGPWSDIGWKTVP
ncbi:MAG: fibronectin type III domain-containing protein [Verrucomicrobiota bacterium]